MTVGLLSFVSASQKVGQAVVNAGSSPIAFLNIAKGFTQTSTQTNWPSSSVINADGFPVSNAAMTQDWNFTLGIVDPLYYGRYYLWWTGTGNLTIKLPVILYSGTGAIQPSAPAAVNICNIGINGVQPTVDTSGGNNGPLEFALGTTLSAAANNAGLVQFTTPISFAFDNTGPSGNVKLNNLTYNGGAFPAGPNADGSWSVTFDDATHFTLQGSGALNPALITLITIGGAGVQSEMILSVFSPQIQVGAAHTISGWSNIVWCKKADHAAAIAGQFASPAYVTAMKALNPRFIRFMDFQLIQSDRSSSYTYRTQPSNFSWDSLHAVPDYWGGSVTNGGSDAYTCANPTASPASGAYVDGEVVIGLISGSNTGFNPTLALSGRTGSAPILNPFRVCGATLINLFMRGSVPPAGTVQTFHFTGGGLVGTYSPTYTTVAGDTSLLNLGNSLVTKFRADATLLAAGITIPSNGSAPDPTIPGGFTPLCIQYNPNIGGLGASKLTVTGSDAAGDVTYNWGTMAPTELTSALFTTFSYSALLGGWFCNQPSDNNIAGINCGPPLEFYADLCNRAGVGCYIQIGAMWSADRISKTVDFFAHNLTGELKVAYSNETWNPFEAEWSVNQVMGNCLGFSGASGDDPSDSMTGLRVAQISQLAQTAWAAAGRSRSQLHMQMEYWDINVNAAGGLSVPTRFNGIHLNPATNAALSNFGGIGCIAITTNPETGQPYNYSASPFRPIDLSDECGGAPYFSGAQLNSTNSGLQTSDYTGHAITVSSYNSLLLAAYNYAYGTPTQQAAALDFLYNENSGPSGDLYNGTLNGTVHTDSQLANFEITSGTSGAGTFGIGPVIASYDAGRASAGLGQLGYCCYEGDLQQGPNFTADTRVSNSLNDLGYTNGYSSSLPGAASGGPTGSSDTSVLAGNNIFNLLTAFKNDNRFKLLTMRYLLVQQQSGRWTGSGTGQISRISLGTHYGFEGGPPFPSIWAFYPASVLSTPFQSWNGYQAFDN